MLRAAIFFLALAASAFGQTSAKEETQIWQLEKAYWEFVRVSLSHHGSHGT
jgi:hypothetical protein